MKIAMVGLGRMGGNMATRLVHFGHEVVAYDPSEEARERAQQQGAIPAASYDEVVAQLTEPRVVWIMVPAGEITESTIAEFAKRLSPGDIIIDGGNSNYKESQRRSTTLGELGISFLDAGVSGGVWGLDNGYCMMVGGANLAVKTCEPIFVSLAPENGYAHVGPSGAGHFVKMIHNGIEYGLMQAYAEGFDLLQSATEFDLDLHEISNIWRYGSVVRSWLLDLLERALDDEENFSSIKGYVEDSGEGRWTIQEGIDRSVPLPVISAALFARFASREDESFAAKVNAALRNQFGGHAVRSE